MKKSALIFALLFTVTGTVLAQGSFSRWIVDTPTAGLMERGTSQFGLRFSRGGGMLGEVNLGLFNHFEMGISYGGMNVIGSGNIEWNPRVEIQAKYRLIDENVGFPAIAVGYSSQGYGEYSSELERYAVKSKGFYGVVSKNYALFQGLGLHAGYAVSLEGKAEDEGEPDFFLGATLSLNPDLMFMAEYDIPISNDSIARSLDEGNGYFNIGARFRLMDQIYVEVDLRNLNENAMQSDRVIMVVYESPLF